MDTPTETPIHRRWWFWAMLVCATMAALIFAALYGSSGRQMSPPATTIPPVEIQTIPAKPTLEKPTVPMKPTKPAATQAADGFEFIGEIAMEGQGYASYIVGVLQNTSEIDYSYAVIKFNTYDKDGNQIGAASDFVQNWEAGSTWKFKAYCLHGDAADFRFIDVEIWPKN